MTGPYEEQREDRRPVTVSLVPVSRALSCGESQCSLVDDTSRRGLRTAELPLEGLCLGWSEKFRDSLALYLFKCLSPAWSI